MIAENLARIQQRLIAAAHHAGRDPREIKLVAVSKHFSVDLINEAFAAGQTIFGENYIQEVVEKKDILPGEISLHFIGHLQRNKAKLAAENCDVIETIDNYNLARTLNNHLLQANKTMEVLIQVNIANEAGKSGIAAELAHQLLTQMQDLSQLKVSGLMTIPPFSKEPEDSRPYFRSLRLLMDSLAARGLFGEMKPPQLSMGMSDDFHIAIEEGATIVRVGTAIFGKRQ
jgi:pyridoxal phosphate enzyme (YggS family)